MKYLEKVEFAKIVYLNHNDNKIVEDDQLFGKAEHNSQDILNIL
jgi:hypothetical protein